MPAYFSYSVSLYTDSVFYPDYHKIPEESLLSGIIYIRYIYKFSDTPGFSGISFDFGKYKSALKRSASVEIFKEPCCIRQSSLQSPDQVPILRFLPNLADKPIRNLICVKVQFCRRTFFIVICTPSSVSVISI